MRRPQTSVVVLALLIPAVLFHQPLRSAAMTVARFPLTVAESLLSALLQLPRLPRLAEENAVLRTELASRQLEVIRLRETLRRVTREEELQAAQHAEGVVASVIGRTIVPTQHAVVLDRGASHGVVRDAVAVDLAGVLGRVIDTHPLTSVAMLVTDPNSRIACLVERSRESGSLAGTGGSLCRLLYLDLDADVAVDDRVVTAGLGGPMPKGILLGTVVSVERHGRTAQLTAWVKPAARLNQAEDVLCLPPAHTDTPP